MTRRDDVLKILCDGDFTPVRLYNSRTCHYLFVHGMTLRCCCWAAFPTFHGYTLFDKSFDKNNFVLSGIKRIYNVRPMSRKVTVMNEVNNFASVNFGHCGKSKHFCFRPWNSGSKAKCLYFPQCPQITHAQLLTSLTIIPCGVDWY